MATREKEKAEARAAARKDGPARAEIRGVRMSARKVRVLADLIRNKSVEEALTTLAFQRRIGVEPLKKVLDSAIANADQRGMDIDRLMVTDLQVNKGPIMRRFMTRDHGRASRIRKQTSHIRVALSEA
ncbi:MAG: 50S ribosomal protein L22 [Myxococcota bacterium]